MYNPFTTAKYQLYLLQLEDYELLRFLGLVLKKGLLPPRTALRKQLVWTKKALGIFVLAEALLLGFAAMASAFLTSSLGWQVLVFLGLAYTLKLFSFVFFAVATLLLKPLDFILKFYLVHKAKRKLNSLTDLKIIGIAGSYGKTTMKEVLLEVLGAKFNVAATPESVNTPVGIARWVLKKFDETLEIAIVEMGEHYQGDVRYLCSITPPDIAVVTGINEAHLERMKTMDNIVGTIFEIVDSSKPKALVILNGDDKNVVENYKKYVWPDHKLSFFGTKNESNFQFSLRSRAQGRETISNFQFDTESLLWRCQIGDLGEVKIGVLGEYALGDVMAAVIIARHLGMSNEEIKIGIAAVKPVEHRLQPAASANNVLVIDDSYNGNPNGAREAVKVLSRFVNRRKICVTPGLAETGKRAPEVHREIGQELAKVANVVILIKNSVTPYIESGIMNYELRMEKPEIIWFNTAQEAYASLSKILQPNDVILFQNDWGDQYL